MSVMITALCWSLVGASPENVVVNPPIYDVAVSTASRDNFIPGSLESSSKKEPHAERVPKPFVYRSDYEADGANAFVIAGRNPASRIKVIRSLTGLDFSALELRMVGSAAKTQKRVLASVEKSWKGIGNAGMRRSFDGFLKPGEKFRDLLVWDNEWVLSKGLTHQKLAEPLFLAIEAHEKSQNDASFRFGQKEFKVKAGKMGGDSFFYELLKKDDVRRTDRSGWIGFGMQGSPFQDEVFANWYFEIRTSEGNALRGDALTTQLIHRYGFYQGGKYRMDPKQIYEMFFK